MTVYHWILLSAFVIFLLSFFVLLISAITRKAPGSYAVVRGNINKAVTYSFTGAMSPAKKESAYLHLPTYAAGMFFHLGTFFCILWLLLLFVGVTFSPVIKLVSAVMIMITAACGVSVLIKRIVKKDLRSMSNPDDYFSNILITGFQILMTVTLLNDQLMPVLFIYSSFLMIYIPLGKLKHTIYFFSSRIHLGRFYGRRGVWPVKQNANGKA
jgi:hypothetical protein